MFLLKAAFCRIFQTAFRLALPLLPYREPEIVGSVAELGNIIRERRTRSTLIVTDKGIVKSRLAAPLEAALKANGVACAIYDQTQLNTAARRNMLHAAYKAGAAFSQSYVGYIHAIAHSLGGQYGTPHGLANAVIMPYVLDAYGSSAHRKLHELGVAAGICTAAENCRAGAEKFIQAIRALNMRMGIPGKLSGILRADIPAMARHAEKEANPLYPVPKLMTARELESIYHQIADWSDKP